MQIGYIGLGSLGKAMAARLLAQGNELLVWNRTKEKAADLNVTLADHPAALARQSDIIILSLFGSDAVRAVLEGDNGLLAADCRGKVIIDTTTNHFRTVISFYEEVAQRGGHYIEAPVLGSVVPASKGELVMLVSGAYEPYQRCRPLLDQLSNKVFYLETPGLATKMKLVNNLILGSFMASLAEAVALTQFAEIPREAALEILAAGAGNSGVMNAKKARLLDDNYAVQFSASLIHKDLGYLEDFAKSVNFPLRLEPSVRALYQQCLDSGARDLDFSVILKLLATRHP
jgi:3-hydroxyisobutyrate dehydrogenase